MTDLAQYQPPQSDLAVQMDYARAVSTGSLLPPAYRGKPADILIAVGLGQAMGLSPAESLYRIDVIQGKPTAAAELIAANVRRAGHRLRVKGDETTCTAVIVRADDPEFEFTVTRDVKWAQQMGLTSKDNYKKQPGTMLQWRAITAVARLACPEALYGVVYTADEIRDSGVADHGTTPRLTAADFGNVTDESGPLTVNETGESITDAQMKALHASFTDAGITNREARLDYCTNLLNEQVESSKDLSKAQASRVLAALAADADAPPDE